MPFATAVHYSINHKRDAGLFFTAIRIRRDARDFADISGGD